MSSEDPQQGFMPALDRKQLQQLQDHADPSKFFADPGSEQPQTLEAKAEAEAELLSQFKLKVSDIVGRSWQLPSLAVQKGNYEYLQLLTEARELYRSGHFYSCVAMSGIVAERLVKDLLRQTIMVSKDDGDPVKPTDTAFDQLERVDMSSLVRFCKETGLVDPPTSAAVAALYELRNKYAHGRGKDASKDSLKAIVLVHQLVEATVSIKPDFEFIDGRLHHRKIDTGAEQS
jgi:hypothetical protein